MIGMNPITTKNNTIVTLHLNDEECGSKRFAPYGGLHRDDASSLHQDAPNAIKHQDGLHELVILPSKPLKDGVWHQVDGNTAIDEHPGDRPSNDMTSNV
jgi:hypothetical protein